MKKYALLSIALLYCFTTQTMQQPADPDKQLEEFKLHQQTVLAAGSFDKPYDPQDPQARVQLIERLKSTLHLRSKGGVNPRNIKSPTTDATLQLAKGSQMPGTITNRDVSNSVLISLLGGIRLANMTDDLPRAQSPALTSSSSGITSHSSAPDAPTTHIPTLVFAQSADQGSFLGLSDNDPVVAATDITIRVIGFESFLDQFEGDELKAQFRQEVHQSPRLLKSASESPGRKSGILTPKRCQSPGLNQRTSLDARLVHSARNSPSSSQSNLQTLMEDSSATTAAAAAAANHSTTIASSPARSGSPLMRGLRALRDKKEKSQSPLRRKDG